MEYPLSPGSLHAERIWTIGSRQDTHPGATCCFFSSQPHCQPLGPLKPRVAGRSPGALAHLQPGLQVQMPSE